MRSRLVMLVAAAVAVASIAFAVIRGASSSPSGPLVARASLPPGLASYLGVHERGTPGTYQPVADFARAAGKQPNLVAYYSDWGS